MVMLLLVPCSMFWQPYQPQDFGWLSLVAAEVVVDLDLVKPSGLIAAAQAWL